MSAWARRVKIDLGAQRQYAQAVFSIIKDSTGAAMAPRSDVFGLTRDLGTSPVVSRGFTDSGVGWP